MGAIQELAKYVRDHAVRVCECGQCVKPNNVADVVFFSVANGSADAETLKRLVIAAKDGEFCVADIFNGDEFNFIELGGWIGDQGDALMLMGLGYLLGLWDLITPKSVDGISDDQIKEMAGRGMVVIKAFGKTPVPLKWLFDYYGEWTALSSVKEGSQYRIQVCDDGSFDISQSDQGLTDRKETFDSLVEAKRFCEACEVAKAACP